jgi:hypothetical protein
MDPNANMAQSKVLVDPLFWDYWRKREKLTLIFFKVTLKTSYKELFFGTLREMLLH